MCLHPQEERQRVFEGRPLPRVDRVLCSLCGELLYLPPAAAPKRVAMAAPGAEGASHSRE